MRAVTARRGAAAWVRSLEESVITWESFPGRIRDAASRGEVTPDVKAASLKHLQRLEVAVRAVADEVRSVKWE